MKIISYLANKPSIFIFLRKIIEFNFRSERKVLKHEIQKQNDSIKILDLGCGTGEFSELLKNCNYTGIDINQRYINYAKNKYDRNFLLMNATKLDFPNNFFDYIVVLGVLHHLDEDNSLKVLNEMIRVLKDDGKIIIMEDVDTGSRIDVLGNLIRRLDEGNFIKTKEEYLNLIGKRVKINENYRVKAGISTYEVFIILGKDQN